MDEARLAELIDPAEPHYRGTRPRLFLFFLPYVVGCALALRGGVVVTDATFFLIPILLALLLEYLGGYLYSLHFPWLKAGRILALMLALGLLLGSRVKTQENTLLPPPKTLQRLSDY